MQVSKVLVVDGDRAARDALVTCLNFVGVEAHGAENAAAAHFWLASGNADVLVLSDELADGAPAELVARSIATDSGQASIIVLTRGGSTPAALANYPIDDTLRRPIALSRVVERVESLIQERSLRRGVLLRFAALSLDVANARVGCDGREVDIGQTEARLLAFFIGAPDKVFSRAQLLQRLWPASVRVEERTVDVHIRRLRLTLESLGCAGYIQTVRGSGYRFSAFA
jgi:two-component system phosphate regulon response regulator PhoB